MKTLCSVLGLLLLIACCCYAIPQALDFNTSPVNCCFNFAVRGIQARRVSHITKSHRSCLKPAFIVRTIKGKELCYRDTFQWALNMYNKLHNTQGSKQQA
ncbi:C-C motif chemokine 4-like [Scomber japonicus]|uniref:C-C motif chemokine 4-like n=1 Tax=Scomber japonicus TaxID=13676 RepID=UPI0023063461|nr:C-C motif chemokine 4-like [Scomber japonicus]